MQNIVKIGLAAAVGVVVAIVGINLLMGNGGIGGPTASASASLAPSTAAEASLSPTPEPTPRTFPGQPTQSGDLVVGTRYSAVVDGVSFSFAAPAPNWEPQPPGFYVSKSFFTYQDAEAIVLLTTFPGSSHTDPCTTLNPALGGATAADLAAAVASNYGMQLVSGPTDVTVGGRAAVQITQIVHEDLGCDPGYFFSWKPFDLGAFWMATNAGYTINTWVVDVEGTLFVIEA